MIDVNDEDAEDIYNSPMQSPSRLFCSVSISLVMIMTYQGGDELPGRDRDSEGTRSSHGRERSATAGSSSSDDSMTGKNALSGRVIS